MANLPADILTLLTALNEQFISILGDKLVGLYVHGSLAMGCFNPKTSDVDFLIVVRDELTIRIKTALLERTFELSKNAPPHGFEFSVVRLCHLQPFSYPTPYELHYSPDWKERYLAGSVGLTASGGDPDLAAHCTIIRARGICFYGEPIEQVFAPVPDEYYLDSIMDDAQDILADVTKNPVYSVLNLCRVVAYKRDRLILSKAEGGAWALEHLDARFKPLIVQALDTYQSGDGIYRWDGDQLEAFAAYMRTLL